MTEVEWNTATDPTAMLTLAIPQIADRQLRLYLVACCRRLWWVFPHDRCRSALGVAERVADGTATETERGQALIQAREIYHQTTQRAQKLAEAAWIACDRIEDLRRVHRRGYPPGYVPWAARVPETLAVSQAWHQISQTGDGIARLEIERERESQQQAQLMRCVFGNPFVYLLHDPRWCTRDVVGLAEGIYQGRAFEQIPILADALEEAGCDDASIIEHCRGPGPHARGCWVVDALRAAG